MTACALLAPGQPCARWATPPRGVCSRQGGARVCADCIRDIDAPTMGFRRPVPPDVARNAVSWPLDSINGSGRSPQGGQAKSSPASGASDFLVSNTDLLGEAAMPDPLIFVVHRRAGRESPALYHDDRLPRECDEVVYSLRLDTQPDWVLPEDATDGDILAMCWELYEHGALPPSESVPSVGKY